MRTTTQEDGCNNLKARAKQREHLGRHGSHRGVLPVRPLEMWWGHDAEHRACRNGGPHLGIAADDVVNGQDDKGHQATYQKPRPCQTASGKLNAGVLMMAAMPMSNVFKRTHLLEVEACPIPDCEPAQSGKVSAGQGQPTTGQR